MLGNQWEGKDKARGRRGVVRVGGGLPVATSRRRGHGASRDASTAREESVVMIMLGITRIAGS